MTKMDRQKIIGFLWWGIITGLAVGSALNPISGFDWFDGLRPLALRPRETHFVNPLWVNLVLTPIALLPGRLSFLIFSAVNVILLWLAGRLIKTNRFAMLLSFPIFWLFWFGQLEAFVVLGVSLGLWSLEKDKPMWTGAAIALLLVKPNLGLPLALTLFVWQRHWKTVAALAGIYLASAIFWGIDWPIVWLRNLFAASVPWRLTQPANIGLFPYGLVAWLGLLVSMPRREKALYILAATIASINYAGVYSLIILLILTPPWWVYLIASAPLLLGQNGYWIASFAAPMTILWLLIKHIKIIRGDARSLLDVMMRKQINSQSVPNNRGSDESMT